MNYLTAVIPVRKNSQRVKRKNFKKFNNENLLIHKIKKLKKVGLFDEIIVNTDSPEAIKIANYFGISHYKREKYYASSKCPNNEFWQNVGQNTDSKYICFTNCTSPLIKVSTYKKAIETFEKVKENYNSLNTVNLVKDFLFLNQKSINFNSMKTPNSQNLPDIFRLNFGINIISRNTMIKRMSVFAKKPYLFQLDEIEGFDIDTKFQFDYANFLHKSLFKN